MKILIACNRFYEWSGAEIIAIKTFEGLSKLEHELFFFATKENNPNNYYIKNYEYAKFFPNFKTGFWNYIKRPISYYYDKNAQKNFQQMLNEIKPDIVHLHTIGNFTNSILNCLKDIPTVMTIHSIYSVFCPLCKSMKNGKVCSECKNGNYIPCIKNKCNKNKLEPSIRAALKSYIFKQSFKNIDFFITPSNALKQYILKCNIGIKEDRTQTIHNFLTANMSSTVPNYTNKKYFLYVGRLEKNKGVNFVLQAAKDLPKELEFHIAGVGKCENKLKQYAEQYNLENIKFLGHLSQEQLKKEYQNCISTIVPSNLFEIFGLVNIESFINGKPVIASNIGGIPEVVDDNINGLLFEPGSVEQLKQHILTYWNNPDLVVEHGKNGYEKAMANYSEEIYHDKIIKIYEKVISEYKGRNSIEN